MLSWRYVLDLTRSLVGEQASFQEDIPDPAHDAERVRNGSQSRAVWAAHVDAYLRLPRRREEKLELGGKPKGGWE